VDFQVPRRVPLDPPLRIPGVGTRIGFCVRACRTDPRVAFDFDSKRQSNPGRARILEAAIELVAEGGYGRATISEVCRLAGVRPPAVYYHYGNKDGLVAAVVETVAAAWLDELETVAREDRPLTSA
jgi:hypothetical protein